MSKYLSIQRKDFKILYYVLFTLIAASFGTLHCGHGVTHAQHLTPGPGLEGVLLFPSMPGAGPLPL